MKEHLPAENRILRQRLDDAIEAGAVFHAYVFISEHKEASEAFAKSFIKSILTHGSTNDNIAAKVDGDRHEDVIVIRKQGASTRIASIRDMQARIGIRPIGERHIVLIADGDEMGEAAQNALLKTLEEPPGNTVIIILATNIENLLPTVRSRSIVCTVEEEEDEESETISAAAAQVIDLAAAGGAYYRLKKAAAPVGEARGDVRRFIDRAEELWRDRLFERDEKGMPYDQEKTVAEIRALEEARNKLERGMSPRYIIKELLLKIGG